MYTVLAITSHPDDMEIACAGTLLKYRQAGHKIFIALTTSGNTGSNSIPTKEQVAAIREAEQLKCCEHYGAQTRFLRFDDEGLLDIPETRKAVLDAIRWADPDLIFVNPPWDPSPDHGMTGKLVCEMLPSVGANLQNADFPHLTIFPGVSPGTTVYHH
jgi:LmbE family N-acetylglucosaminyl deacetylase